MSLLRIPAIAHPSTSTTIALRLQQRLFFLFRMSQPNRYPSPEPGNPSHPYHNSQQQMPSDVAQHIQPAPVATMQESAGENHPGVPQNFQFIAQYGAQPSTPQQLAQQGLEANGSSTDPAKKRNKVSRACDECRRKKVLATMTWNS